MGRVLIRGGRVVDGRGAAAFDGHVLLNGAQIEAVLERGAPMPAVDTEIDASGKVVAPGFIDMHSHVDWLLTDADQAALLVPLVEQGVTTVVAGNCGVSPAPHRPATVGQLEKLAALMIEAPLDYRWDSMSGFLDRVQATAPLVNVAQLVGHAALRYAHSDTPRGAMPPDDQRTCLEAARTALDEGACGLSFGLGYDPGMYSTLDELTAFAAATSEAGKPLTVHIKALSRISPCYPLTKLRAHNVLALEEMLAVARETGARLQVSHLVFVGRRSWGTAERCLTMIEDARRDGVDVMFDAFPFTCGNTTIDALLPYWFLAKLPEAYRRRRDRALLRVEFALALRLLGFGYADLKVMNAAVPEAEELEGLTLVEVAARWKLSPFAALLELSRRSRGAAMMLLSTYSGAPGEEGALDAVLASDNCLLETDAVIRSSGYPNPAALGTYPRILGHYVRERGLIGLEEAVRRSTGASAERFGLADRGTLAAGQAADVVVFDPETIGDTPASGREPAGRCVGIEHVFVNGAPVVAGGRADAAVRMGQVLRT